MKKIAVFCLVIVLSSNLLHCFGEANPLEGLKRLHEYPSTEGTYWDYSRVLQFKKVFPDSLKDLFGDTLFSEYVTVKCMGKRKLLDLIDTFLLVEGPTDSIHGNGTIYGKSYYANQQDGMYLHGHMGTGMSMPKNTAPSLKFSERYFLDINDLLTQLSVNRIFPVSPGLDSVHLEVPPKKVLQYPIKIGAFWIYRKSGDPFKIAKKITGQDFITVKAGNYVALQVKWLYDFNEDGEWDEDIEIVDDYADIGLVKRTISLRNLQIIDEFLNVIGSYDYLEVSELLSYGINPES